MRATETRGGNRRAFVAWFAAAAVLVITLAAPPVRCAPPQEALCPVCHVDEGTNHPEPVKATRTHEGREFHFCSERCAGIFEKNPSRYRSVPAAAPVDTANVLFPRFSTAPT